MRVLGGLCGFALFGLIAVVLGRALLEGAVLNWVGAIGALLVFSGCALYALDHALSGWSPDRVRWAEQLARHLDRDAADAMWSERWSWRIGSIAHVPIRIHWTLPLGLLLVGDLRFNLGKATGLSLLMLIHELGHAALMRRFGVRVTGVLLHAAGGECKGFGAPTPLQQSLIAWGGVLAQGMLWALVAVFSVRPRDGFVHDLLWVFTVANPVVIALNLLPIRPLDGALAWRLPLLLGRRRGSPARRAKPNARPHDRRYLN